jgi:hypothetical protein
MCIAGTRDGATDDHNSVDQGSATPAESAPRARSWCRRMTRNVRPMS